MLNQDEIIEMARQAGFSLGHNVTEEYANKLQAFTKLVAAKEREACAKLCEKDDSMRWSGAADVIRARGEPTSRGEA